MNSIHHIELHISELEALEKVLEKDPYFKRLF